MDTQASQPSQHPQIVVERPKNKLQEGKNGYKKIRQSNGLSQQRIAQQLGISKSYVTQIENGKRPLTPAIKEKIKAQFLTAPEKSLRLKGSIDWVSLHFRTLDVSQVTQEILQLNLNEFSLKEYGRYHYSHYYTYGSINVYADAKDERQGVTIECSGNACHELEALFEEQKRDWYSFFNDCLLYENQLCQEHPSPQESFFNVTRLDIALDEPYCVSGNYSLYALYERFNQGLVSSRKREYRAYIGGTMAQNEQESQGLTLYIGSRKSPLFFRFYEKDAEQAKMHRTTVEEIHNLYGYKNRYEIVLRKSRANRFIRDHVAESFDIVERGIAIINSQMIVFSDLQGHLDEDWNSLMSVKSDYNFKMTPRKPNLNQTWIWAERNVFPTLSFLKQMDEDRFNEYMSEAVVP
ncbi:MAG: replication initiation factor domain-containing protein [Streptococcaceae bacterium]|nr:replication initiation factor domain-containing protein [Streptococcaceae bacterium]